MRTSFYILLSLILLIQTSSAFAADLTLYDGKPIVRIHSKIELTTSAREGFEKDFKKERYYGAYAVSSSGAWAWESGYNSLKIAIKAALKSCNSVKGQSEQKCKLYASIVPKDYTGKTGFTLNKAGTETYYEYKKNKKTWAIAASKAVHWSARSRDSIEDAKRAALNGCNTNVKLKTLKIHKVYKCKIIASSQ